MCLTGASLSKTVFRPTGWEANANRTEANREIDPGFNFGPGSGRKIAKPRYQGGFRAAGRYGPRKIDPGFKGN